jgi:hypothetical protein
VTNRSHNEVNGNIRIVVTADSLKHDNEVVLPFCKQTMEFPVGKMKDLTEIYNLLKARPRSVKTWQVSATSITKMIWYAWHGVLPLTVT